MTTPHRPFDPSRRDFLRIGGAGVIAGVAHAGAGAAGPAGEQTAPGATGGAAPIETVRIGFVGVGLQGSGHVRNLLRIPGCRVTAVCDVRPERTDWATEDDHRGRPSGAHRLHAWSPRLRADVRDRRSRPRLQRDPMGVARAGDAGRDEERQTHRHRGAGGHDARRLLGDGRGGREAQEALRDDGELQLRPHGDDGLQHGPAGPLRRDPPRRRRLSARPARDQVRRPQRRTLAPRLVDEARRQPLSHARPGPGRELPGHQSRRSLRLPGLDERPVARTAELGRGARFRRTRRSGRKSTCWATSTRA